MRTFIFIFSLLIACLLVFPSCIGRNPNAAVVTNDTHQTEVPVENKNNELKIVATLPTPEQYKEFRSYFPDAIPGKVPVRTLNALPANEFTRTFYTISRDRYETDDNEELYPVTKMKGKNGLEFFVITRELFREDEDNYDNHVEDVSFVIVFNGGKLLMHPENTSEYISYGFSMKYFGEGGESELSSWFDKDHTIISHDYTSESESSTGYVTPLCYHKKYRWTIDKEGNLEILDVMQMEFSSPFFHDGFLTQSDEGWREWEENNGSGRMYPTENSKWKLDTTIRGISVDPMDVYFYCRRIDGNLHPVFEIVDNFDEIIDTYTVGVNNETFSGKVDYSDRDYDFNMVIVTSEGDLEVLANGRFALSDK